MRKQCGDAGKGRKLLWYILLCCVLSAAFPLLIYVIYSTGDCCPLIFTTWTPGELLSYCGTLFAATIAILGVYWSLRSSRQDQERQIRDEAAPFFSAVFLTQINKHDPFTEMFFRASGDCVDRDGVDGTEDDCGANLGNGRYKEVDDRKIYVFLDGGISYQTRLSEKQEKLARSRNLEAKMAGGVFASVPNPVIYNPIYLKNVGKGAAVSVRVGVNPKGSDWAGVQYWTLMPGDYFYLGLYVDTDKQAVFGEYELRVVYFDCLGCQYIQRFELKVVSNDGGAGVPSVQMAYYGPRELLSDEERGRYLENLEDFL